MAFLVRRLGRLGRVVVAVVLAAGLMGSIGGLVAHARGYRFVVITTGSMQPVIPIGALVIVSPEPATGVAIGDVIVMNRRDRGRVTHRVVALGTDADGVPSAVTQGDANEDPDAVPHRLDGPTLVSRLVVPGLGGILAWLGSRSGQVTVVAMTLSLLAVIALAQVWSPPTARPLTVPARVPHRGGSGSRGLL